MLGFTLNAFGKAAHSGYPWLGRSANEVLVQALSALMQLSLELPKSDKYGSTTINIGKIEGGVAGNVVAQNASAQIAIRIAAGTPDEISKRVRKAIKSTSSMDRRDICMDLDRSSSLILTMKPSRSAI
jgi:acetylornithine deacetylase